MKKLNINFRFILIIFFLCSNIFSYKTSNYYSPENYNREYRKTTRFIILHTTEGPSKGSLQKLHKNGEAHYLVNKKGDVYRIINRRRVAFHCGTSMWNSLTEIDNYSIGIEVVGYHNDEITKKQKRTLNELLSELQQIYGISDKNVLTHSMVAYGKRNRWFKKSHRGRKRCGMLFALKSTRKELGLLDKPLFDPDVKRRRLINADIELANILYGNNQQQSLAFKNLKESSSITIDKGRSAWDIAKDDFNKRNTLYIFPNGKKFYGNQIKNWKIIPAGTKVKINQRSLIKKKRKKDKLLKVKTLGVDGNTASEAVGKHFNKKTTIYVTPEGQIKIGNTLKSNDFIKMPKNTVILVGYAYKGKITETQRAYDICKKNWNHSSTFYRLPNGKMISGQHINEKKIPDNSLVFFKV